MTDTSSLHVVPELLRLRASYHPDRIALNVNGDATMTYAGWERRVNSVAHGLLSAGVHRGQRIALLFNGMDWLDYAVAYLAVLNAGGTAVHLNNGLPRAEILRRLDQCKVSGIVHGADATPPPGYECWSGTVGEFSTGDTSPAELAITPTDISDILYTSGTTGLAKAFTVPHGNLTYHGGPEGFRQFGDPTPLIVPMPLGTTSSSTTIGVALTSPATLILSPVDDVERMAELIVKFRIGSVMITPWIAIQMLAAEIPQRYDLSCVETMATASAPFPPSLAEKLLALVPTAKLNSAYSESEAVPAVVVDTFDPRRPRSVGKPSPGTELRVADENGDPVPPGQLGEVWLRCGAPKRLYLDNQELNNEVHAGGWTRTRDLAYLDEDGYLNLFDRRKDAIRTSAGLVSSIWVEAAIYEYPAVREAAVLGVPAADGHQEVAAVVVLDPPDALDGLRGFLAGKLPAHEVPARYLQLDALPRSQNGKVVKHELRERLARAGSEVPDDPAALWDWLARNPHDAYRRLRTDRPLAKARFLDGSTVWLVSRYDDVRAVLGDPRFSNAFPEAMLSRLPADVAPYITSSLIVSDDPQHGRLRRLLSRAFSGRRIGRLRDHVVTVADALLDEIAARGGKCDLAAEYSYQLPIRVIHEILTVPEEHRKTWSDAAMASLEDRLNPARLADSIRGLVGPANELIRLHRDADIDDLLTDLIQVHDEREGALTGPELVATTLALVLSGFSTTSWFISGAVWALLTHPGQLRILLADPGAVPGAVDELMRWLSPVDLGTKRYATAAVEIAGGRIEPGEVVVPLLSSANRDPDAFPDPERLDVRRSSADRHVGLGYGPHYCLGAALARLEGEIAITRLFTRFPGLRLTVPAGDVAPRLLQGVRRLPVALS